jgi:hypothetical protein
VAAAIGDVLGPLAGPYYKVETHGSLADDGTGEIYMRVQAYPVALNKDLDSATLEAATAALRK